MKHTERWLIVSIVIIGLMIILLGVRMFQNYSAQVSRVNATTENTESDVISESADSVSATEEQPYGKICNTLSISEIVEMTEPLYCGGYKLEVTGVDITRENMGWLLADEFIEGLVGDLAENGDILSEEQYIAIHIRLTACEEYLPYVEEGVTNEISLNTMRLELFTEEQELTSSCEEMVGVSESDGMGAKDLYQVNFEYGESKELDIIFVDSAKVLTTEEKSIAVLKFNPSGMDYGVASDLRKGMVLDVPN